MQMEKLKNQLVLFKFIKEIEKDFRIFGVKGENTWFIVTGVEPNGIWVEHPNYECRIWWDGKGNLIPQPKQKKEKFKADIFIPWRYIKGIMCIRDKRFEKTKNKKIIGFKPFEEIKSS